MKTLDQLRSESEILFEQNELSENNKLLSLARSGLVDKDKLTLLRRALAKDNEKMTRVERNALLDLLDRLTTVVTSDKGVFNKVRQDVMTEESKVDIDVTNLPPILILKRRAIRVFPDGQKVALYWADRINKYISVPFQSTGISEAIHLSQDDIEKNPKLHQAIVDADEKNPPPAPVTPPPEEEKPAEKPKQKNYYKRMSPRADRINQKASEIRDTVRSDFKNDYSTIRSAGAGRIASLAGAIGVSMRRASLKGQLTSRVGGVKESFESRIKLPTIKYVTEAADDNPFEWKRERPAKGITAPIKGKAPERPGNTSDPYEDPDSSLHQQQQNIQRRANRNFASSSSSSGRTVYESLQKIVESSTSADVQIAESTVYVTPAMAKNIIKLYESVNKINKAVMLNKLCESEDSFFKLLDFAVKKV